MAAGVLGVVASDVAAEAKVEVRLLAMLAKFEVKFMMGS